MQGSNFFTRKLFFQMLDPDNYKAVHLLGLLGKTGLDLSGAKVCKSCTSRKTLKNDPGLAIAAVHTEENEPRKIWGDFFSLIQFGP